MWRKKEIWKVWEVVEGQGAGEKYLGEKNLDLKSDLSPHIEKVYPMLNRGEKIHTKTHDEILEFQG